jgi:LacI family transcriptional regulator
MFSAGEIEKLPGLLTGDSFNAAIICNTVTKDDQFLARHPLPYPTVLVNRSIAGYPSVSESHASGYRAAEILAKPGRKRLAVLHGSPLTQSTRHRVDAFVNRASELLGIAPEEIVATSLREIAGYNAMKEFWASGKRCDALYTVSDGLALGAYQAIKQLGMTIPRDISVMGVGDYENLSFFDPPLSSVGVSHSLMADQASLLLMEYLQKRGTTVRHVPLPILEVLRASTDPV